MANEISYNSRFVCTNGNAKDTIDSGTLYDTQATQGSSGGIVSVGTSEEDLAVGDVATPGWVVVRNLDSTNFVKYGPKSGGSMIEFGRIMPGDQHRFYLSNSVTLRWVADTAAVKVQVLILER